MTSTEFKSYKRVRETRILFWISKHERSTILWYWEDGVTAQYKKEEYFSWTSIVEFVYKK